MKKTLIVGAVLALAVIGGLQAAIAAPSPDTKIAIEHTAPAPLVDLPGASVKSASVRNDAAGGTSDAIVEALAATPAPSSPPRADRAGAVMVDRQSVGYHLLL